MVDIVVTGRHIDVPARLRAHAEEKLAKVAKLTPKAIRVDVEVSRERNPRMAEICDRVELTCISRGPVIRAEAAAPEMIEAFDLAWAKLESRLRRAADRRRVHRGVRTPVSVASATAGLGPETDAGRDRADDRRRRAVEVRERRESQRGDGGGREAGGVDDGYLTEQADGPMLVREKLHIAAPMTLDQALYEMELVGHAFFLFADKDTGLPSVVYRRRGYDYGVIRIDTSVASVAETTDAVGVGANGSPQPQPQPQPPPQPERDAPAPQRDAPATA
jgi:ribosomal subunit interface protein